MVMRRGKKSLASDFVIGFILTLLVVFAFYFSWKPMEVMEYRIYDLESKLRVTSTTSPIVIVAIDDDSITRMGRWPWPRGHIAKVIDTLNGFGARIVGADILYSEKDFNQGLQEVEKLRQKMETEYDLLENNGLREIYLSLLDAEKALDNDAILASSITESKRVILPLYFVLGTPFLSEASKMPDYLQRNSVALSTQGYSFTAREIVPPIPTFASQSMALGHINAVTDVDGTLRSEPLLIRYQNRFFPTFALQLTLQYLNLDIGGLSVNNNTVKVGNLVIPVNEYGQMLISYRENYSTYSFVDVTNGKVPPGVFKNKIVIIGHSASGLGTRYVTPINVNVATGVIIANVIDNILTNNHVIRPDWAFLLELGVILIFGLFLSLAIPRLKAGISAVVSLFLLLAWSGAAVYLLVADGYWIKVLYPSLLLLVGYAVIVSKRYLLSEKTKEHIEADSVETNRMLGLSFQGQGMLDMAFDKFRKCPVEDEAIRELLYNLGLDFERKRMFNKAVAVYEHIMQAGKFKDIDDRIKKLTVAGETMIFGTGGARKDDTVLVDNAETKPTLGRYEIIKELGRGAMGTVYFGKDPKINRDVAIKTLRYEDVDASRIGEVKQRFFREAEAAGKLAHPNIVTIYDVGEDYDIAYMAMEFLDGTDLEPYCNETNLLPLSKVLKVISSVAQALDYAHENGVVHRDIKPANIMILNNGEVKVTDFGIARVMESSKTQTGIILGTPSYMSPEQIAGQKVDGRSDLFSLGVVLYELLTGEKPFMGDSIATLMYSITTSTPPPLREVAPNIPEKCATVIEKILAKDRDMRYQSGVVMAKELAESLIA
jgi:CHASE2 domain-containing sensor protein/tRNA A-37 threonylcarbamoyl transferase component Bud32